jgi:hypothetical protein
MRKLLISLAIAAAIAAPAVAVSASANATAASTTRVVPCIGHPEVKPGHFVLACGDGNWYLTDVHWARWTPNVGIARSTEHLDDCMPNCAAGTFHTSPAVVVFSNPVATKKYGSLFAVVTVLGNARLPGSNGATWSQALPLQPVAG